MLPLRLQLAGLTTCPSKRARLSPANTPAEKLGLFKYPGFVPRLCGVLSPSYRKNCRTLYGFFGFRDVPDGSVSFFSEMTMVPSSVLSLAFAAAT